MATYGEMTLGRYDPLTRTENAIRESHFIGWRAPLSSSLLGELHRRIRLRK